MSVFIMTHAGYVARAWKDDRAAIIFGEVIGIRDVVTFEGRTREEAQKAFEESVDLYLKTRRESRQEPNRRLDGKGEST